MKEIRSYRLRKCSDIDMEYPYFEILDQDETVIMDVSKTNEGELYILFYDGVLKKSIPVSMLYEIVNEAIKQIE